MMSLKVKGIVLFIVGVVLFSHLAQARRVIGNDRSQGVMTISSNSLASISITVKKMGEAALSVFEAFEELFTQAARSGVVTSV
ncbi:MAG: hypothetical protein P9X27_04965 [Candidatus Kaelpia aquatica]|nr:hypothetical protein [Candidatus Kaelpia aquatica]